MRCSLGLSNASTCLPPAGTGPGGVLVIVDQITQEEDRQGKQAVGRLHQLLASYVHRHSGGKPFIFDSAVKCHAGAAIDDPHVDACRSYLATTLAMARPERIIVTGSKSMQAVLGRGVQLTSVRKGYGWLWDAPWAPPVQLQDGRTVRPVPVYLVMPPFVAATNPFLKRRLEEDIRWAVTAPMPQLPPWDGVTQVIETEADARLAATEVALAPWCTFDIETSGRMHAGEMRVVSCAISIQGDQSWVWDAAALADPGAFEVLAELLEDPAILKVAQNAKFDLQGIEQAMGVTVRGLFGDTRVWRKQDDSDVAADLETMGELVGMGGGKAEMGAIVDQLCGEEAKKAQQRKRAILKANPDIAQALKGTKDQVELLLSKFDDRLSADDKRVLWRGYTPRSYVYGEAPTDKLSVYNALDTLTTHRLSELLYQRLMAGDLMHTWTALWGPATEALCQVETWGFPVDIDRLRMLSLHFESQLKLINARFAHYQPFNPNSPEQVQKLLYGTLKLKPPRVSEKTGNPSADKDSLEVLRGQHPIIDDLIEHRHVSKLKSQYADGLILHIAPDGRIHTTYNVDGARSGRASSENPNMQNIPSEERDPQASKLVKDCFVASPGYVLLAADYAQLEFRVAADLSDDPDMRAVFISGKDFHQATAEFIAPIVWKIQPSQVTKTHRRGAKSFNFGIMYGMQDGTIAERAGCDFATAKAIRAAVLGKFKRFASWIQQRLAESRKHGVAWTYWQGRKAHCRQLYNILDENQGKRINAENSSYNTPVQGTASFYCLASVAALVRWILANRIDAKVVATVHDSIVFEVRPEQLEMLARKVREVMCGWPTFTGVPLDIDMKTGTAWGSLTTYDLPEVEASAILGGPEAAAEVVAAQFGLDVTEAC